ncbi:hypothetical protein KY345_02790, partial [Candidatus Woesearchaeota archaeon]|nr:hypothetical protein [Candidatus Woesearchaeota archaeon]
MRKTITTLSILLVLIFVAGCYPTLYTCPDGSKTTNPEKCPSVRQIQDLEEQVKDIPAVEEVEEVNGKKYVTVPEIKAEQAFKDFVTKVNTYDEYEFKYRKTALPNTLNVAVLGDRMKYRFERPEQYENEFYNVVVLDLTERKAYQYCEGPRCDLEDLGFARQIDFEDRAIPTLKEVMNSIVEAEIIGDEMMMDRSSKKVSYVDNEGVEGTLWVDKYYGIPLRKEYYVGE